MTHQERIKAHTAKIAEKNGLTYLQITSFPEAGKREAHRNALREVVQSMPHMSEQWLSELLGLPRYTVTNWLNDLAPTDEGFARALAPEKVAKIAAAPAHVTGTELAVRLGCSESTVNKYRRIFREQKAA